MDGELGLTKSWCGDMTRRDRRNLRRFLVWALVWMAAFLLASFAFRLGWVSGPLVYPVALFPSALGVWAVRTFLRFLREADELQRKIQLESLGWAFGCGAVFMIGYRLLERAGLPQLDTSDPLAIMMVCWALATVALGRRYS